MVIESFEALEKFLRELETWDNRGGYDVGGVMILLAACLDNLRHHAVEDELNELGARLDPEQMAFFAASRASPKKDGVGLQIALEA